jgi:hypothetical protein
LIIFTASLPSPNPSRDRHVLNSIIQFIFFSSLLHIPYTELKSESFEIYVLLYDMVLISILEPQRPEEHEFNY